MAELKTEQDSFEEQKKAVLKKLAEKDSEIVLLREEVGSQRQDPIVSQSDNHRWVHIVYGLIILALISVICVRSCGKHNPTIIIANDSIIITNVSIQSPVIIITLFY